MNPSIMRRVQGSRPLAHPESQTVTRISLGDLIGMMQLHAIGANETRRPHRRRKRKLCRARIAIARKLRFGFRGLPQAKAVGDCPKRKRAPFARRSAWTVPSGATRGDRRRQQRPGIAPSPAAATTDRHGATSPRRLSPSGQQALTRSESRDALAIAGRDAGGTLFGDWPRRRRRGSAAAARGLSPLERTSGTMP
jgi:hypothetical protein